MKMLSYEEARRVYDRIGAGQDTQAFYEDAATDDLIRHGEFESAGAVFEFGCGTGRFAEKLLREHLGATALYRGVDVSPKMIALATGRLSGFGERARVALSEGAPPTAEDAASCDRFVSNYVFDLLSEADIAAVLSEAHRMLRPAGLLCLTSLGPPRNMLSRVIMGIWSFLHRLNPKLVGGCRPVDLCACIAKGPWKLRHHRALAPFGLPSEVVIAERL